MTQKKKIAVLTHFAGFQDSYALHVGWMERARLLEHVGEDFDFLVNDNCRDGIYPHQRAVLGRMKESAPFDARVEFFRDQYLELLAGYDAILTADLIYQRKGNFLAYNAAMRAAAPHLKAHWYHWIHSGWTRRPAGIRYPESLRYTMMDNSTIVYLNGSELAGVAEQYGTDLEHVACVYNPKDPRCFFDFHPLSREIVRRLDIPSKHAVQIFPHCATRMDAKGIDAVIRVFAALKRAGLSVALILAQGNARRVQGEIAKKKRWMARLGLVDGEDYLFTCDITENFAPLPRRAVADLYRVANLFVFGSWRETVGNCFQEALVSGNLLVLNQNLPPLTEMGGPDAIWFDTTYKTPGVPDGAQGDLQQVDYRDETKYFDELAARIIERLPDRSHLWRFSYDWIWENQLRPLLYGGA